MFAAPSMGSVKVWQIRVAFPIRLGGAARSPSTPSRCSSSDLADGVPLLHTHTRLGNQLAEALMRNPMSYPKRSGAETIQIRDV